MTSIHSKTALALDFADSAKVSAFLQLLDPKPEIIKIGLELTSSLGIGNAVELIKSLCPEAKIFLDLKLHDIPATVAKTLAALLPLQKQGVEWITVHTLGGPEMIEKAVGVTKDTFKLIGVTILTSHSQSQLDQSFKFLNETPISQISLNLVESSYEKGLRHFVCSPHEAKALKNIFPEIKLVTPGIRLGGINKVSNDDQSRASTPLQAIENGSDMLVVGRPLTQAEHPQEVWLEFLNLKQY
jgi:orotidine-5'-phosphate decarboxylase